MHSYFHSRSTRVPVSPLVLALAIASSACGDDSAMATPDTCGDDCDTCIEPDKTEGADQDAVQTAFVEVKDGETICLAKGTFHFAAQLDLEANGVTVRGAGMDDTTLDFSKQDLGGNAIAVTGDDTVLEGFTIQDAHGDGIRATDVDGFTVREVAVLADSSENAGYGIYPVGSSRVLVERSRVTGASDTGIYVGQSSQILIRDNEVYENVAGIEVENSMDSEVTGNHAHDNAAGILTFNLPELPVQGGARCKIHDNVIEHNNHENFATAGNVVADVPSGTGVLMLATDDNEVHDNEITGNVTTGVLIISYIEPILGAYDDTNYDVFAEGNWIHDNTFADNGANPQGLIAALFPAMDGPDIGWDGCFADPADATDPDKRNCISNNGDASFLNVNFAVCGGSGTQESDPDTATCEHESLPAIDL